MPFWSLKLVLIVAWMVLMTWEQNKPERAAAGPRMIVVILAFTCVFGVIASVMVFVLHTFSICHLGAYKLTNKLDLIQKFEPIDARAYAYAKRPQD